MVVGLIDREGISGLEALLAAKNVGKCRVLGPFLGIFIELLVATKEIVSRYLYYAHTASVPT